MDKPSILIVDDEPADLAVLSKVLSPAHLVLACKSSKQAIEVAGRQPHPDLILLDVMMPEMDGYTVLSRLRENEQTRDIPVIFISALGDESDEEKGLRLGAVDYLTKPVKPAIVLARVSAHVEIKRARDRLTREIEERKQAEKALEQQKKMIQRIIEKSHTHLVYLDRDFNFLAVNPTYAQTCRYAPDELIGKNHFHFYPDEENEGIFRQVRETGETASFHDKPFTFPDQPERGITYWDWTLSPIKDESNHVEGLVFSLVETTERKRAEEALRESNERFRAYMDNSPAIAWMKDEIGQYVYLSSTYERRFGVRLKDWRGKTDFEVWPREIAEEFRSNDRTVLETGYMLEVVEKTPDPSGNFRYWWNFKFLFTDAKGKRYVGGMGMDITERKQAEEKIAAALAEKEILLREVHHRVKNNLASIVSLAQLQMQNSGDEKTISAFRDFSTRIKSMALIHEDLYRSTSLGRIDVASYARRLIDHLLQAYGWTWPGVVVDAEEVFLDIDQAIPCGLLLTELVTNALKYAFPDIESRNRDKAAQCELSVFFRSDGRLYTLRVGDNGIGLPHGMDLSRTKSLGLKLVNMIATMQLNGTIEIDTHRGTTFTIRFPVSEKRSTGRERRGDRADPREEPQRPGCG